MRNQVLDEKEILRRKKLSISSHRAWQDPEHRKKMLAIQRRQGLRTYNLTKPK